MNRNSGVTFSLLLLYFTLIMIFVPYATRHMDFFNGTVSADHYKYGLHEDQIEFAFYEKGVYQVHFEYPKNYHARHAGLFQYQEGLPDDFSLLCDGVPVFKTVEYDRIDHVRITITRGEESESHLISIGEK